MPDADESASSWSEAVSDASRHVEARVNAQATVHGARSPGVLRLATLAASGILIGLMGANAWVALQPATQSNPLFYARENRVWTLVDAADLVEDFRLESGRLPTATEVSTELGPAVTYEVRGDIYVVSLADKTHVLEYESSMPLEDWLSSMTGGKP